MAGRPLDREVIPLVSDFLKEFGAPAIWSMDADFHTAQHAGRDSLWLAFTALRLLFWVCCWLAIPPVRVTLALVSWLMTNPPGTRAAPLPRSPWRTPRGLTSRLYDIPLPV